jgi:ubiquinol-cytochrome c reductase cytochrome b subunit
MSLLPFPSFLDDVQRKGLRKAVAEGVNETVERITAGLNIQDVREALRGDEPSRRPNPRLTPHADGFWLHMRPGYFHKDITGTYPTFRLGWLSTYFVFFETITGVMLMFWYTPSPEIAYGNMLSMLGNVPLGQFMRDLHRLGAEAMVAIVALHMMRTWITGSYKKPRQFTWFTGVLLLLFTGLLSFTGYLLPWDQLSLWAVTIGASMAEASPVIGEQANLLMRGAPELGANGLLRFYMAHVLGFPLILFIFLGVHYYKVIIHAHSLPPQKENIGEDTAKRVPLDKRVYFIPDILTNELLWAGVTTFVMVVLVIWFYHAPLEHHADPQQTPLGTTAPWYFLWIQGALKLGDKFIWGILFPTLVVGILAVMPYLDVTPSRRYADRRLMLSVAMLTVSISVILSYMGLPEFAVNTSAESEIIHELTFPPAHSKVGVALTVPYDQLVPGAYTTAQFDDEDPQRAIDEFNAVIGAGDLETISSVAVVNEDREWSFEQPYDHFRNDLTIAAHLDSTRVPTQFRVVPDDAPELRAVLEELHHKIELNADELPNAWGALVISDNQDGLRRLDVAIFWDGVQIEDGKPALDANGEVLPRLLYLTTNAEGKLVDVAQVEAEDGSLNLNFNSTAIPVNTALEAFSEQGTYLVNMTYKDGAWQVVQQVDDGTFTLGSEAIAAENVLIVVREQRMHVEHIFIHEDAAYFG